jgi:hypothetical protein
MKITLKRSIYSILLSLVIVGGLLRVVSTYNVFNQTIDERAHIHCGLEWLQYKTYRIEEKHTPLARIAVAVGPYLFGTRLPEVRGNPFNDRRKLLYSDRSHKRTLFLARLGTLPFFLFSVLLVWFWCRELCGPPAALLGVLLLTSLPPVLAHAGLATTDMALASMLVLAFYLFTRWLEKPTWEVSVIFGIGTALALLSKLSTLVFLPAGCLALLICWMTMEKRLPGKKHFYSLLVVFGTVFVVTWGGYRFSVGPLEAKGYRGVATLIDRSTAHSPKLQEMLHRGARLPVYPAPELVEGLGQLFQHNERGHKAYLFGRVNPFGWWYYFPVALAVKTPVPFLILALAGCLSMVVEGLRRRSWRVLSPAVFAAVILVVSMTSNINIGVRHILPIFPLLAVAAGCGARSIVGLFGNRWKGGVLVAVLLSWHFLVTTLAHPDYLAYFNGAAGSRPELILNDSNLDWGQDLERLADELQKRGIEEISLAYFGDASPSKHGLKGVNNLPPDTSTTGWIAISSFKLHVRTGYEWLKTYTPEALVGRSIHLYYIPEKPSPISQTDR